MENRVWERIWSCLSFPRLRWLRCLSGGPGNNSQRVSIRSGSRGRSLSGFSSGYRRYSVIEGASTVVSTVSGLLSKLIPNFDGDLSRYLVGPATDVIVLALQLELSGHTLVNVANDVHVADIAQGDMINCIEQARL